ncbi:hypothetical protein [Fodinicola feengrottensis]|uniref:Uncharacterized protein n=1 Tax=Fodinicola feengrottensis TaxID=435914 RepID=A0ABN2J7C6_9ACTN|nr:hypothetical protein [Fodinicola feengrottensis]
MDEYVKTTLMKCICVGVLAGASVFGATEAAAAAVMPVSAFSPDNFAYVRGFSTLDLCNQYGVAHYNGYNNSWFCVQDTNPNNAPWALYAEQVA